MMRFDETRACIERDNYKRSVKITSQKDRSVPFLDTKDGVVVVCDGRSKVTVWTQIFKFVDLPEDPRLTLFSRVDVLSTSPVTSRPDSHSQFLIVSS